MKRKSQPKQRSSGNSPYHKYEKAAFSNFSDNTYRWHRMHGIRLPGDLRK